MLLLLLQGLDQKAARLPAKEQELLARLIQHIDRLTFDHTSDEERHKRLEELDRYLSRKDQRADADRRSELDLPQPNPRTFRGDGFGHADVLEHLGRHG
jgi:hypothetical protein